ncbi:hypothetical protein HGM15179_013793 [Zosterops borbonicus]|uniref:Uncharacterized protein n=1 Tax=Zosterops borbonicus TaxID=364589 RepID=A0A8K1LGT8_9PASS|nr:hypothetical protein HGM15179_013793 [Zosterops borbonicus]
MTLRAERTRNEMTEKILCEKTRERDSWKRNPQSPEQLEVVTNCYIPNKPRQIQPHRQDSTQIKELRRLKGKESASAIAMTEVGQDKVEEHDDF